MKASVIILTKNPGKIFRDTLSATLNQVTPWEYETIVIDSGSRDGTIEFTRSNPRVRLLTIPPSEFGHGRTRNLGAMHARGEFIAYLTHDAIPANQSWLVNLVNAIEQRADIACAFGRHEPHANCDPITKRDLKLHFDGFSTWNPLFFLDNPSRYSTDQGYRQLLHYYSDNNSCLRKRIWEMTPYPDVDFAEDQIWAKKIIELGYKKAYVDNAVVFHSHSYGATETFRRSFDEARAFKVLFGYHLGPTLLHCLKNAALTSIRDARYIMATNTRCHIKSTLIAIANDIGRQIGYYLGTNHQRLPTWCVKSMSRDMKIQHGK